MTEPKTKPQSFAVQPESVPSPAHAGWLEHTEQLLAAFERARPDSAHERLALGFVLLAADAIWDQRREQADFALLDVRALVERSAALLRDAGVADSFGRALSAFYGFLAEGGHVDPEAAEAIAAQCRALADEFEPDS